MAGNAAYSPDRVRRLGRGGGDADVTDEEILAQATNPDGSQRFYPAYEHPATRRLREHLDRLLAFGLGEDHEAVIHARQQLARFEWGEDRAKHDYLAVHRGD